jgi:hypothetical protein
MKLNALLVALAVAGGFAGTGVAQAATDLVIDDWDIMTGGGSIAVSSGVAGPNPRAAATGGNSLTRGERYVRELTTPNGTSGVITLFDPTSDKQGGFSSDLATAGWGYWSWTGGGDLSGYTGIAFDYVADQPNADVILAFFEGTALKVSKQLSDLPGTAGVSQLFSSSVDFSAATAINEIRLYVLSAGGSRAVDGLDGLGTVNLGDPVSGLDFRIDNLKLTGPNGNTPEPTTLALFGLGLAGLGAVRRRKPAA